MNYTVLLFGFTAFISLGILFVFYRKIQELNSHKEQDKSALLLQNQINELNRSFNDRMREHNQIIQTQLEKNNETLQKQFGINTKTIHEINNSTTKAMKEVTDKLMKLNETQTKLTETNTKVVDFAKQMQTLENILRNPKQRGILGEYFLENLLSTCLPPEHYRMQYTFSSDGKIVDAVIFVEDKILPIDAKFSLQSYNEMIEENDLDKKKALEKDFKTSVKVRIDETSKYVRVNEKTTDVAMMFIPADGLYYNLLTQQIGGVAVNTQNLIEYAFSKKVTLVSPMTLFAYLQTIMQAIRKFQVIKNIDEIVKCVGKLGTHIKAYDAYMLGLGKSLETTVNKYNTAYVEFKKVDKDVVSITDGSAGGSVEVLLIEKPKN